MQSAFEKEILQLLLRFRSWLTSHDRAVLIGLLFAIPPIPPVPFIGFLLALFNYKLWKQHKLDGHEIGLIRISLVSSIISSAIAIVFLFLAVHLITVSAVESGEVAKRILDVILHYLRTVTDLFVFQKHGEIAL